MHRNGRTAKIGQVPWHSSVREPNSPLRAHSVPQLEADRPRAPFHAGRRPCGRTPFASCTGCAANCCLFAAFRISGIAAATSEKPPRKERLKCVVIQAGRPPRDRCETGLANGLGRKRLRAAFRQLPATYPRALPYVRTLSTFLRWHDPDQVRRDQGEAALSQPMRAPLVEFLIHTVHTSEESVNLSPRRRSHKIRFRRLLPLSLRFRLEWPSTIIFLTLVPPVCLAPRSTIPLIQAKQNNSILI